MMRLALGSTTPYSTDCMAINLLECHILMLVVLFWLQLDQYSVCIPFPCWSVSADFLGTYHRFMDWASPVIWITKC